MCLFTSQLSGTHYTYPQGDGQAELNWVAGYRLTWFTYSKMVTHPSTNSPRRSATTLIETKVKLPTRTDYKLIVSGLKTVQNIKNCLTTYPPTDLFDDDVVTMHSNNFCCVNHKEIIITLELMTYRDSVDDNHNIRADDLQRFSG